MAASLPHANLNEKDRPTSAEWKNWDYEHGTDMLGSCSVSNSILYDPT